MPFSRTEDGKIYQRPFGGMTTHYGKGTAQRTCAAADRTGHAILHTLYQQSLAHNARFMIEYFALDLIMDEEGACRGVLALDMAEGTLHLFRAQGVVLATGGYGRAYFSATSAHTCTGDGGGMALRAGLGLQDMEFVQFHPTSLYLGPDLAGQQPLVSEAMRGEGAFLVDAAGRRVISTQDHPLADLAPRDVVAKAITRRMLELDVPHVYLDARHLGEELLLRRFPTIVARCRESGIDPVTEPVPVAPAAHYASGGVRTDLDGHTDVPGLYACGEVACTGVHGANRLASNSLLEGLVFAARIGAALQRDLPPQGVPVAAPGDPVLLDASVRLEIGRTMTEGAGVLRSAHSLASTAKALDDLGSQASTTPGPAAWEATDLHLVATALVAAATLREETRGAHWREDHPDASTAWEGHLVTTLSGTVFEPLP